MRTCELCKSTANAFCESDHAILCWNCDAKVHGANFLVARHLRSLLCHACQTPTPWKASGSKLGNTVTVCESCVNGMKDKDQEEEEIDGTDEEDDDEVEPDGDIEAEDREEEEDGDNQVVPWSSSLPPVAADASSSSSEESVSRSSGDDSQTVAKFSLKRIRDDLAYSSSQGQEDLESAEMAFQSTLEDEKTRTMSRPLRPWMDRRI